MVLAVVDALPWKRRAVSVMVLRFVDIRDPSSSSKAISAGLDNLNAF
jgi:hypothetical protein